MLNLIWAFAGDCDVKIRKQFGEFLKPLTTVDFPDGFVLDYDV